MKYNIEIHHRRSIRLKGYDYSQLGMYFITLCAQNRECLLGKIDNEKMILNDAGKMVETVWNDIPRYYRGFCVHENIVMPNHFHGIIEIVVVGAGPRACPDNTGQPMGNTGQPMETGQPQGVAPTMSLSDIVHRFKTMTTKKYIDGVKQNGWTPFPRKLWQRNYYEHIIRNDNELNRICEYIVNNPLNWDSDRNNPSCKVNDTRRELDTEEEDCND
jgi:putative transposase